MNPEEQKIYQEFTDYFRNAMSEDDRLARFAEKLTKGEATYVDAWDYARRVGGQMSDALLEVAEEILLSEDGYDIVMSALHDGYQEAAEYAAEVQTLLNQEAGIGIRGVKPDFMTGRASGIAHQASNATDLETAEYYLGSPAQHFTENVVGDTIKANEEFQYRSGLNPKIKRTAVGGCCEWCQAVAGEYDYPAPDEIYRRHANCDCLVEYYPGNGLKQNAHTKRWMKDAEPEAVNNRIMALGNKDERTNLRVQLQTGGKESGGKNYKVSHDADEKTRKAAEEYRRISRQYDADIIAKNTGFTENEIIQIKRHIFFDKHKLYEGYGMLAPDYDMAVAWKRMKEGRPEERDILLLKHEKLESELEKKYNLTLSEAHARAQEIYNWEKALFEALGEGGEPYGLL